MPSSNPLAQVLVDVLFKPLFKFYTNPQPYNLSYVVRLLANGQPDPAFTSSPGGDGTVNVTIERDGKFFIGGTFTTFAGILFRNIGRINADGTSDLSFNQVGSGPDAQVNAAEILGDGSIIIGGDFINYQGHYRPYIAKLSSTGLRDGGFNPSAVTGPVSSISLDGDVIVVNGSIRLNADGSPAGAAPVEAETPTSWTSGQSFPYYFGPPNPYVVNQPITPTVLHNPAHGTPYFCFPGHTAWTNTPFVPPNPGFFSFYVGIVVNPGFTGNVVDPTLGAMKINPTPYQIEVTSF